MNTFIYTISIMVNGNQPKWAITNGVLSPQVRRWVRNKILSELKSL